MIRHFFESDDTLRERDAVSRLKAFVMCWIELPRPGTRRLLPWSGSFASSAPNAWKASSPCADGYRRFSSRSSGKVVKTEASINR